MQRERRMARHYFKAALRMRMTPKILARYLRTYLP